MTATWSNDGGIHEIPLPGGGGRLWLCGKHVVGPDVEGVLTSVGARTVVCLVQRHELAERFPAYTAWLDAHGGDRALWYPVPDLTAPPLPRAQHWLDEIDRRLSAGEGLVMHCAAGRGRAGTMAVGLLLRRRFTLTDALEHVRLHRPGAGPEAGGQMALVRHLADESHGSPETPPRPH